MGRTLLLIAFVLLCGGALILLKSILKFILVLAACGFIGGAILEMFFPGILLGSSSRRS